MRMEFCVLSSATKDMPPPPKSESHKSGYSEINDLEITELPASASQVMEHTSSHLTLPRADFIAV